jgi:hypothetical protein
MRITRIAVSGFRSIKSASIDSLPRVAGFWGPKGSGKSALLQAVASTRNWLLSPRIGIDPPPEFNSRGLSLGSWQQIAWKGQTDQPLDVRFEFEAGDAGGMHFPRLDEVGGAPTPTKPAADVKLIRYFPPARRTMARWSSVKEYPFVDLAVSPEAIHPFIHWFYHEKNRERLLTGVPNEVDRVDYWMQKVGLGRLSDRLVGGADGQVSAAFIDQTTGYDSLLADGGFGGVTFAPLVLEAYSFRDGVLLIEEPEISLHPGAQADAFDFFLEVARERGHQILFTSHSDYLLARLVRAVRDEPSTDVGVFETSKDSDGSHYLRLGTAELIRRFEAKQQVLASLYRRPDPV